MLRKRFNLDAVPGMDLENRPQRTTEVAPVHVRRTDREPMMRGVIPPILKVGPAGGDGLANGAAVLMFRVRQRAKRPSTLGCSQALGKFVGVLAAIGAGRQPKPLFEQPVEIGGVSKATAIGDIGDRCANITRRNQGGAGALQAPIS